MTSLLHGNRVRFIINRSHYMIRSFVSHGDNSYTVELVGNIDPLNFRIDIERNILDYAGVDHAAIVTVRDHGTSSTVLHFQIQERTEETEPTVSDQPAEVIGYLIPADALLEAAQADERPVVPEVTEDAPEQEIPTPAPVSAVERKECACGCGARVFGKKSSFAMGHDAKAKSLLQARMDGTVSGSEGTSVDDWSPSLALIKYIESHEAWYARFAWVVTNYYHSEDGRSR